MYIKKYNFLFLIVIFITGVNCSKHFERLQATRVSWEIPILDKEKDTIVKWDGSSKMFFYKDILLYEKEVIFIQADNKERKTYTYWMYRQNHKKGLRFKDGFQDTIGITFDVDSFLVKNAFKNFPFYSKENDSLVFSKMLKDDKELIEKYIPKSKPDESYPDTMIFRYSKLHQDIPFSFSAELEKGKQKKLIEITNIYNPVTNGKYKAQLRSRKMFFTMERIPVENEQEKIRYFKRFEKTFE